MKSKKDNKIKGNDKLSLNTVDRHFVVTKEEVVIPTTVAIISVADTNLLAWSSFVCFLVTRGFDWLLSFTTMTLLRGAVGDLLLLLPTLSSTACLKYGTFLIQVSQSFLHLL